MTDAPLVDVHAHYTTTRYIAAAKAAGHTMADGMPAEFWPSWSAEEHLALMDRCGISKSYLSISSPGVHFGDDSAARLLARRVNDAGAEAKAAHPDRFGLFASLPMPDLGGALVEIDHAFDELDADGVIVMSNAGGTYFGSAASRPLLEELDRRHAVVFLHPTSPPGYELVDIGWPRPMIEFYFDTARAVISYIANGFIDEFSNIKLILPHIGGVLPLLAQRVEMFLQGGGWAQNRTVQELLGDCYFDLAGNIGPEHVAAMASVASSGKVLFGSDYCWTAAEPTRRRLDVMDEVLEPNLPGWRATTTVNATRLLSGLPSAEAR
ncbi:amidohydrolase family protein [Brevibacterium atlanticum]|uniref:amidohydrolase family protein n=1 Tax=Brevibacterium atlanticum TaxID=2697563 RepID=UPI00141FB826|nr:amidohydrolase family protein [Brevibacterium atlanticum]